MAFQDKIYDIAALDMAKRLELFLNDLLDIAGSKITLGEKIDMFRSRRDASRPWVESMSRIACKRNDIVHPKNLKPVFGLDEFKAFQKECFELENDMRRSFDSFRIKDVLPTLKYDMGNAGDIIKHGLLAEFVAWWGGQNKGKTLRVADTFAGCPWDNIYKQAINDRIDDLRETPFGRAQHKAQGRYLGSGFLVRQVAEDCGIPTVISLSDNDPNALCNFENAIMEYKKSAQKMRILSPGLPKNDGYGILRERRESGGMLPENRMERGVMIRQKRLGQTFVVPDWMDYDLVLLDPYAEFLVEQCREENRIFNRIRELIGQFGNVFIVLFVLDMKPNRIRENFDAVKKEMDGYFYSLRCPRILKTKTTVSGESTFDSEVLIISKQIADRKCGGLHSRLRNFADKATDALPLLKGSKVEFRAKEDF